MRNKYNAIKVKEDGYTFDSKKEHKRYKELKLLQRSGEIKSLIVHPNYYLWAHDTFLKEGEIVGKYNADFSYFDNKLKEVVVEDVKSKPTKTPFYNFKKKMMKINYGIEIKEIL